jgi:hypothetical protein
MQMPTLRAHVAKTPDELRQRIDDYTRVRHMIADEQTIDALDYLIDEARGRLRHLESPRARLRS